MGFLTDLWDKLAQLGSPLYNGVKAWFDGADSPEDYYDDVIGDYSPLARLDSWLNKFGNVPGTDLPWTVVLIVVIACLLVYLIFFRRSYGSGGGRSGVTVNVHTSQGVGGRR